MLIYLLNIIFTFITHLQFNKITIRLNNFAVINCQTPRATIDKSIQL